MSVNVTTYHYDNIRDGANTQETTLTPANVNSGTFGKIASLAVDGQVYAQPLVMTNIAVAGQGTHDIVLAATQNDTVYAFDAKGNNPAQGYLWKTSLLQTGEVAPPGSDFNTSDITGTVGVTGTPVIDPTTNTLYVVGKFRTGTSSANYVYTQRIETIDITTGTIKNYKTIAATVPGSGDGYTTIGGVKTLTFSAKLQNQRPALTLANGEVYIAWASHGDNGPFHGWLIAYNASTLNRDYVYNDDPNGGDGGIWMSGGGLAVDSSGNLYFTTGNGTFDANTGGPDYSMAVEKLSPSLGVLDYFAPYNQAALSNQDLDYGCSDVILLSNQTGSAPNEVLSEGKWGTLYLNNAATGSLGQFHTTSNTDLAEANITSNVTTSNVHNTMAYFNGHVYEAGDALPLQSFQAGNGTMSASPVSVSAKVFGSSSAEDGQGAGPTVSANGTTNGIVWALDNSGYTSSPGVLYAYDANNLGTLLYSSTQAGGSRDAGSNAVKFQDPVVANGYVYTAGAGSVTIYGLLSTASTATPTLTAAASAGSTTVTGTTTTLSAAATDPAGDAAPTYSWAATTLPAGATAPTFSVNGTTASANPTVTYHAAGSYTFTVTVTDPTKTGVTTSSVTVVVTQTSSGIAISPTTAVVVDGGTQQFTASVADQFGLPLAGTQPTFTYSVNPGGVGGTINSTGLYTAPSTGTGTATITATSGSTIVTATAQVVIAPSTTHVNLSGSFNKQGIVTDGTTFTGSTALDGGNADLSSSFLPTTTTLADGDVYIVGAANTSNVVSSTGQTISVPAGQYTSIDLLATRTNGAATDTFTINFSDGTASQTITQSFSDWYGYATYPGQTKAVTMTHRDLSNGSTDARTFYVCEYTLAITGAGKVSSITLPNDSNVAILGMNTVGYPIPTVTTAAAASPSPVTGTTTTLSVAGADSAADAAPLYTWAATTIPGGANAPTFSVNGSNSAATTTATFHAAGAYTFTVTILDPTDGESITSTVNVTVNQTASGILINPPTVPLTNGKTQQFAAALVDQFGTPLAAQPTFTWTLVSGIGTVSTSGLYTAPVTGTGSATVRATASGFTVQGVVTINQPFWLAAGSAASWNSATGVLTVTGAATIVADPGSDQPLVQASGSAAVLTINPTGFLKIHLGGLTLTGGASAVVTSLGSARTAANHRVLVLGPAGATSAPPLSIDATSKLNLTDNDLVDHDGSLTGITALLTSGFNLGNGNWTGPGIDSSVAATSSITTLGGAQVIATGTVDAEPVTTTDVEVRYAYDGDANLDGKVDGSDYALIDNGYNKTLTGWHNGDFNYDGVVDGSDYTLIDNAFNTQTGPIALPTAQIASPAAQIAAPAIASVWASSKTIQLPATHPLGDLEIVTHATGTTSSAGTAASGQAPPALVGRAIRVNVAKPETSAGPTFAIGGAISKVLGSNT